MSVLVVATPVITVLANTNTCCNSHSLHHDGGEKTQRIDEQLMDMMIMMTTSTTRFC